MVGSNRIVPISSIVHPLGDPDLSPGAEKEMRRSVVEKALETLKEGA
jgi:betaine reductase